MNYRQWKKNYKKRYGVNPPASIDKRKQRKAAARALNVLANTDFSEALNRAAENIASGLANIMRTLGSTCDRAGTVCRNVAENIQPLEIRGNIFSEEAAEKIAEILRADQLEYVRHTKPERIQKRQGAADALTAVFKAACETGGFEQ